MFIGATKKKSLLFGKDDTDFVRDSHKNDLLHDGDQTNRYFGSFSKDSDDDMSFILDNEPPPKVQGPDYAHATYDITSKLREDSQISSEAGDRDDYLNSWIVEMKEHPLYMEPTEPLEYSFYNPDWADASIFDDTIRRGGEEKYHILKVQGPDHVHATYDITSKLPEDSQISFEGGDVQLGFTAGDVQVGNFAFEVQLVEDDSITLTGVDAASLEASDFAFA